MTTPHPHLTFAATAFALVSAVIALAGTDRAAPAGALAGSKSTVVAPTTRSSTRAPHRATVATPGPYTYGWPVRPFRAQHPVRGFFGDPRIANQQRCKQFHFGVDVSAPNGTPVYATLTGTAYINSRHSTTVEIIGSDGVAFSYWHIHPAVTHRQHVVAYETVIGHIEKPYGHVHFSEKRDGRYLNPLRPGAMGPFADGTRPWVTGLRAQVDGRRVDPARVESFDLVVEAYDETPIAIPRPWHDLPVTPALVRWRILDGRGHVALAWRTAADFRLTIPPASNFSRVWAPGTTQNHVRAPGSYLFTLAGGLELGAGRYKVEVAARDVSGNATLQRFELDSRSA